MDSGWDRYQVAQGALMEVAERVKGAYQRMVEELEYVKRGEHADESRM